ncbi:MAG: ArsR family transcriptional regulator [Thermoplasmatota archaeon]
MEIIRNKGNLTRLLILRELVIDTPKDQRSIADSLDITPQAISDYLRKMADEGLVDLSFKPPHATIEGVEELQRSLLQMKTFIDTTIERLDIVRSIDAVADADIEAGDPVRLFMKNGLLYCSVGEDGSSTGRADVSGSSGDLIMISDLSGVVEVPETTLYAVEVVPARSGGGSRKLSPDVVDAVSGRDLGGDGPRIAVMDLEAASLLLRSGIDYQMEMPEPRTIRRTLDRGLDIVCFGTPYSLSRLIGSPEITDLKKGPEKVEAKDHYL